MEIVGRCGDIYSLWKQGLLFYLDLSYDRVHWILFLVEKRVNKSIVP